LPVITTIFVNIFWRSFDLTTFEDYMAMFRPNQIKSCKIMSQ